MYSTTDRVKFTSCSSHIREEIIVRTVMDVTVSWALLIFLCVGINGIESDASKEPKLIIQTDRGPIEGEVLKTVSDGKEYYSFKGIPYANQPVRFKVN